MSLSSDLDAARAALRAARVRAEEDGAARAKAMAAQASTLRAAEAAETKAASDFERLRVTEVNIKEATAAREVAP